MAKYHITHSCGHTLEHRLDGPERERPARRDRLAGRTCNACRTQEAAASNQTMGMPPLTGTDRQIAWAESIRNELAPRMDELIQEHLSRGRAAGYSADDVARTQDHLAWVYRAVMNTTSAGWWIDHRSDPPRSIMAEAAKRDATSGPER